MYFVWLRMSYRADRTAFQTAGTCHLGRAELKGAYEPTAAKRGGRSSGKIPTVDLRALA
jgi:hypothetical protein